MIFHFFQLQKCWGLLLKITPSRKKTASDWDECALSDATLKLCVHVLRTRRNKELFSVELSAVGSEAGQCEGYATACPHERHCQASTVLLKFGEWNIIHYHNYGLEEHLTTKMCKNCQKRDIILNASSIITSSYYIVMTARYWDRLEGSHLLQTSKKKKILPWKTPVNRGTYTWCSMNSCDQEQFSVWCCLNPVLILDAGPWKISKLQAGTFFSQIYNFI